jgi:hypothetical protein
MIDFNLGLEFMLDRDRLQTAAGVESERKRSWCQNYRSPTTGTDVFIIIIQ